MTDTAIAAVFFGALLVVVCAVWATVEAAWLVGERKYLRECTRPPRATDDPFAYRGDLRAWREEPTQFPEPKVE